MVKSKSISQKGQRTVPVAALVGGPFVGMLFSLPQLGQNAETSRTSFAVVDRFGI